MAQETPWSSISPLRFLRDVAANGEATLTVAPRPDVRGGLWYTITWVAEDGERHSEAAPDLALLMSRAASTELAARRAWEGDDAQA
jgi:hypothetical protein